HPMQHPRIVTLLFTDVEGSTPLLASLGEAYVGVIGRQRAILTGAAGNRRGSGYPTGGDGCVFIFGSAGDAGGAAVEGPRGPAAEARPGGAAARGPGGVHAGGGARVGGGVFCTARHHGAPALGAA